MQIRPLEDLSKDELIALDRQSLQHATQEHATFDRQGRGEPDRLLHGLLAIIHRDGGHYRNEHGTEKAVQDAIRIVARLIRTANPTIKESLTTAEPVKVPSDDLLNALRAYEQANMDGSLVKVSRQALDEAIALLASYGKAAQPADPYDEHMAKQASLINMERLRRWMTAYGISTPASLEEFAATFGKQVNALTRNDPFPKQPAASVESVEALSSLVNALRERHYGRMPDEVQQAYDRAWAIVYATPTPPADGQEKQP